LAFHVGIFWNFRTAFRLGIKLLRLDRLIIVGQKLRFGRKIAAFSLPEVMLSSMR
jgi:hypothetical protein